MYVRWQRRTRKQGSRIHNHAIPVLVTATLVESRRIDGKPRQHHVAYLGGIRDTEIQHDGCRDRFWEGAEAKLAALNLPESERVRIEAALEDVVPRLPAEQSATIRAERRRTRAFAAELNARLEAVRVKKRAHGGHVMVPNWVSRRIVAEIKAEMADDARGGVMQ